MFRICVKRITVISLFELGAIGTEGNTVMTVFDLLWDYPKMP
jgi:hypothetical protein